MNLLESLGIRWLNEPFFALNIGVAVMLRGACSLWLSEHSYRHRAV